MLSMAMTSFAKGGAETTGTQKLLFIDVSRAYFYAPSRRPVFVKLPDKDNEHVMCGRFSVSMYGTRDAAASWKQKYSHIKTEELFEMVKEVKSSMTELQSATSLIAGRLDSQDTTIGPMRPSLSTAEPAIQQAREDFQKVQDDIKRNHQIGETRYAERQGQVAVMQMQKGGGGITPSGTRSSEPLVTHKLIISKEKITGDEDFTVLNAWIEELETDLEIMVPGAKAIMIEAQASKTVIGGPQMMGHVSTALATRNS